MYGECAVYERPNSLYKVLKESAKTKFRVQSIILDKNNSSNIVHFYQGWFVPGHLEMLELM